MAIKVSDLVEVEERTPHLLYSGEGSEVLHIIRKEGKGRLSSRGNRTRYMVTECNRTMDWGHVYTGGMVKDWGGRLCTRCGTPEQFQETLREYHRIRQESDRRYKERQRVEEAERERIWNLAREAAHELAVDLGRVARLKEIAQDSYRITAVFEIDGRRHLVKMEVWAEGDKID